MGTSNVVVDVDEESRTIEKCPSEVVALSMPQGIVLNLPGFRSKCDTILRSAAYQVAAELDTQFAFFGCFPRFSGDHGELPFNAKILRPADRKKLRAPRAASPRHAESLHHFDSRRRDFTPYGFTCEIWEPRQMQRPDRHDEIEINFLDRGTLTYLIGGERDHRAAAPRHRVLGRGATSNRRLQQGQLTTMSSRCRSAGSCNGDFPSS